MAMEQQYQERRRGSDTCLVCGRRGGNTIVVTSVHSFVSASGTPLADFLVKVVGEDPCYSVSEVICQQCFVLLDRLDAYQARAAEIHTHLTSRYRDTKLELLGQRQRMSELIASSLSNVKELRHGTTLNVSDELTITVVHEALPKKRRKLSSFENGSAMSHIYTKPTATIHGAANIYSAKSDSVSQYISKKIKRKRVPEANSDICFLTDKKKLTLGGSVSVNNNNNIAYANCVKSFVASKEDIQYDVGRTVKRKTQVLEADVRNSSTEEELSDDTGKENHEQNAVNDEEGEEDDEDEEEEDNEDDDQEGEEEELEDREEPSGTIENDDDEVEKENDEESSDDDSSSDSDEEDGSGSEQDEDDVKSETQSLSCVEQEQENNNEEEDDDEEEEEEAVSGEERDPPFEKQESSLDRTSQDQTLQHNTKPQSNPSQQSDMQNKVTSKIEPSEQIQLQTEAGESVSPQVAEAMLMQSPLATSLLQSFLATSLWFGSPETSKKKKSSSQTKQKQQHQVPDDVTSETLAVTAASTKDKKKRQELKNTGQSYVNTKGKLVDAKRVWPQDCSRCPLKCNARISEEERQKIFAEYWGLADYNLQREYLAAHMQREEKLGPSGLLRTVVLYFLTRGSNTKLQVCRQFFLKTLDVSEKASRIVLEKMVRGELGSEGGTATPPPVSTRPQSSQEDHLSCKNGDEGHLSNEDDEAKSEGSS